MVLSMRARGGAQGAAPSGAMISLLGREQFLPNRVEALEGFQHIVLAERSVLHPCHAPGAHHDLRRADRHPPVGWLSGAEVGGVLDGWKASAAVASRSSNASSS
jgi:hypothetical protein